MDRALALCANLLRLAALADVPGASLRVVSLPDVVASLLGEPADVPERGDRGAALMAAAVAAAQRIEARATQQDGLYAAVDELDAAAGDLLALHHALRSPSGRALDLQLGGAAPLRLIRSLLVPGPPGGHATALICAIEGAERLRAPLAAHTLAERLEIAYERDSPFPLLTVRTPSMSESAPWAVARSAWQQRDGAEHDLELFNNRSVAIGAVRTAWVEPPLAVRGGRLALDIQPPPGARLLATDVRDRSGAIVTRCIRIVMAQI